MSEQTILSDYREGDVVIGFFSGTDRMRRERAVVQARFMEHGRPAFTAREIDPPPGVGPGTWGYDDQIEEIERRSVPVGGSR